jgi:hypothetical protein
VEALVRKDGPYVAREIDQRRFLRYCYRCETHYRQRHQQAATHHAAMAIQVLAHDDFEQEIDWAAHKTSWPSASRTGV